MRVYYDRDADVNLIKAKKVAVIGYGSQGHAHANNLRDSGVERGRRRACARARLRHRRPRMPGSRCMSPPEAAKWADIVMVLAPDELQAALYNDDLSPTCARAPRSPSRTGSASISG